MKFLRKIGHFSSKYWRCQSWGLATRWRCRPAACPHLASSGWRWPSANRQPEPFFGPISPAFGDFASFQKHCPWESQADVSCAPLPSFGPCAPYLLPPISRPFSSRQHRCRQPLSRAPRRLAVWSTSRAGAVQQLLGSAWCGRGGAASVRATGSMLDVLALLPPLAERGVQVMAPGAEGVPAHSGLAWHCWAGAGLWRAPPLHVALLQTRVQTAPFVLHLPSHRS